MSETIAAENDLGPEIGIVSHQVEESVEAPDLSGDNNVQVESEHSNSDKPNTIKIDSFEKFNEIRRETKPKETKALQEKKESNEKETEKSKQDQHKSEEEKIENEEEQVTKTNKPEKKPRDYSGLTEAEVPIFKRMAGEAFDVLKPILLEYKQLKAEAAKPKEKAENGLPDSYFEHPEAFTLSPEYKQLSSLAEEARVIKDHWRRQEINIKRTGKFQGLTRDAKTGSLELTEPKDADENDELNVSNYADAAREQYTKHATKLDSLTSQFKDKHNKDIAIVKGWEEQFFPGFEDEKHPTKELQKQIIEALPKSLRSNPVTKLLSKVGSANAMLMAENKTLKAELNKIKGIKSDSNQAPPNKNRFVSANKDVKTKGITSFSDFEKLKRGELV